MYMRVPQTGTILLQLGDAENIQMTALSFWEIMAPVFGLTNYFIAFYAVSAIIWQFVIDFKILLKHSVKRVKVVLKVSENFLVYSYCT